MGAFVSYYLLQIPGTMVFDDNGSEVARGAIMETLGCFLATYIFLILN